MRIAILIPLAVSTIAVICTIFIHLVAGIATINLFRIEKRLGRAGAGFWFDVAIIARVISLAFAAHLIEIAVWALLFVICGEFTDFGTAYYHYCQLHVFRLR